MLVPIYDRIVVKQIDNDDKTRGGLYLPIIAKENSPVRRAEVVAAGHGRVAADGNVRPLVVAVGDVVLFVRQQSNGTQLIIPDENGDDLIVIMESHIIGTIVESAQASATATAP